MGSFWVFEMILPVRSTKVLRGSLGPNGGDKLLGHVAVVDGAWLQNYPVVPNPVFSEVPVKVGTNAPTNPPPTCQPSLNKIAFVSDRSGNNDIYTTNANGCQEPTRLTYYGGDDSEPVWSHDNTKIAYTSGPQSGSKSIYMMKAEPEGANNQPQELTTSSASHSSPAWSPDGTRIAFSSNRDGDDEIYVMKAEPESATNVPQKLTNNSA
jgi:dipeptidyl aminopeptidase/acylaminoacyl peptidase